MIDTWMNMWTKGPETVVTGWTAMQDAVPSVTDGDMPMWLTSMATPVMAPAMMGVVAANTAAATWAGFWMSAPQASAAAFQALAGGVAAAPAKKASSKAAPKPTQAKAAVVKPVMAKTSPKVASKPVAKAVAKPTVKAAAKPATRKAVAPKATPAVTAAAKAAPKVDDRPSGLDAPKGGKADDLKRISGVGPKLESVLNDLGIYHFDQVAGWTKKESDWVDTYLRFKGRIARDGWIAQAKTFAKEAV
ncbi:MAG: NADH:quinone oxidoreductase [Pseudomonadota bacterium]